MTEPTALTTSGRVRGRAHGALAVFKGIPYAREPFGPLRFRAPQEPEPWEGTREAAGFGPRAPQSGAAMGLPPWTSDEGLDCLTVNVWTPDPGGSGLPVMVWLYGGAYMFGSSDQPDYDGTVLASAGLVVVTFNYRLGMEGFGELAGAPSNRALLDQVAALRWVRDNIAAFGGDPDRVTAFGESAGAGSLAALLAMPAARGLFRRAIAQSVPGPYFSPGFAGRITEEIAGGAGLTASAADLAGTAPEDLFAPADALAARMRDDFAGWGPVALSAVPYSPVVDGEVLPSTPWEALAGGAARGVDLITGFCRDEYRLFMALGSRFGALSEADLSAAMRALAPPDAEKAYRAEHPDAGIDDLYALVCSDWLFRMPTARLATAHARAGGTTYAYELAWPAPAMGGLLGACHGLDVPLTFGNLDVGIAMEEGEKGAILLFQDKNGEILFKDSLLLNHPYKKNFNLEVIPNGVYYLILEKENSILKTEVTKTVSGLEVTGNSSKIIFKPQFKVEKNLVRVFLTNPSMDTASFKVLDRNGIVIKTVNYEDLVVTKTFDFSKVPAGKYTITVKVEGKSFTKEVNVG